MRFGYCTGFATPIQERIDYALLEDILQAGYDYAEFPLARIAALPDAAFDELVEWTRSRALACDAMCNMFPATIRLTGPARDDAATQAYLERAIPRMHALGGRVLVFGSSGARNRPDGVSTVSALNQLTEMLTEIALPLLERYDITLVVEPIGRYEANFINTLPDGMELVRRVNHPRVQLLADSVHLLYEGEDPAHINMYRAHLRHVHLCEDDRALPVDGVSDGLKDILRALRETSYDLRASFEPMPYDRAAMQKALANVRAFLA